MFLSAACKNLYDISLYKAALKHSSSLKSVNPLFDFLLGFCSRTLMQQWQYQWHLGIFLYSFSHASSHFSPAVSHSLLVGADWRFLIFAYTSSRPGWGFLLVGGRFSRIRDCALRVELLQILLSIVSTGFCASKASSLQCLLDICLWS